MLFFRILYVPHVHTSCKVYKFWWKMYLDIFFIKRDSCTHQAHFNQVFWNFAYDQFEFTEGFPKSKNRETDLKKCEKYPSYNLSNWKYTDIPKVYKNKILCLLSYTTCHTSTPIMSYRNLHFFFTKILSYAKSQKSIKVCLMCVAITISRENIKNVYIL